MDESYRSIEDENKFVNTTLNLPLLLDNQITLKVYMFMKDMNNTIMYPFDVDKKELVYAISFKLIVYCHHL